MGELRQNMATKRWVIIATERAKRPHELSSRSNPYLDVFPSWDPHCPFCPGNEELDLEVMRVPNGGSWQVRVVRNRYPALQEEGERIRTFDGVNRTISAVGYHEVLVESRQHNSTQALESPLDVALIVRTFQSRGHAISADPRIEHIVYFKNHGERAGTTLLHPHAQIMGLPMVPFSIRSRAEQARRHFDDSGSCVFCAMLADELSDGARLVVEERHFVAFVPFAAASPFHLWVLPRRHEASFLRARSEELDNLGLTLRRILRKLYVGLHNPDYNYIIRSAPLNDEGRAYLHWYITIIPRVTESAGFELGSGMFINTTLPEESAAFLRGVDESVENHERA